MRKYGLGFKETLNIAFEAIPNAQCVTKKLKLIGFNFLQPPFERLEL